MAGGRFHQEHENGPLNPFMVLERKVGNHTGRHYYFKKLIPAREVQRKMLSMNLYKSSTY